MTGNAQDSMPNEKEFVVKTDKAIESMKRLANWYKAVLGCFVALPFLAVVGLGGGVYIGLLVSLIMTLVIGIRMRIQIKRSSGVLLDNGYATPAIITPAIIILAVVLLTPAIGQAIRHSLFTQRLQQLGGVLFEYAESHGGQLPEADRWCDILKENTELSERAFGSRGKQSPSCDYAMNKYAAVLGESIPANMVLLFESKVGWNQVGGQELLRNDTVAGYIGVLFGDKHAEMVKGKYIPFLRWEVGDSGIIAGAKTTKPFFAVSAVLVFVFASMFAWLRGYVRKYWIFALVLGLIAAGVGMLFGAMAESTSYPFGGETGIGWIIGGMSGFPTGICFVLVLGKILERRKHEVSIVGYGSLSGIVTGIVCSIIGGFNSQVQLSQILFCYPVNFFRS